MIDGARIRRAMDVARANGWQIADSGWCDPRFRTCCALGSVAVEMGLSDYDLKNINIEEVVALELGATRDETADFVLGFDGSKAALHTPAYKLGWQFREEWLRNEHELL